MTKCRKYSNILINGIINLYNTHGFSYRKLGKIFNIPKSNICRQVNGIVYNSDKVKHFHKIKPELKVRILQFLKNSTSQNPFNRLIDYKIKILKKFKIDLSKTTISKLMKILNMTKKKISVRHIYRDKEEIKKLKLEIKQFFKLFKTLDISK